MADTVKASISLDDFIPQQTGVLALLIPGTNNPIGWEITFGGPSHPKSVAASEKASRKALMRSSEIEKARVNGRKWKGDMESQPEEVRREFIQSLVDRMVSWTPVALAGKEYVLREGNAGDEAGAVELLLKPEMGPYVQQIVDWLVDDKAFMKASAIAS